MKERSILVSTPMVKVIMAGTKTVTRRIIAESFNGCLTDGGPHPCPNPPIVFYPGEIYEDQGATIVVDYPEVRAAFFCSTLDVEAKCRFGKPGDVLWVRETYYDYGYWFEDGYTKTDKIKWRFQSVIPSPSDIRFFENPPEDVKPNSYRKLGWYKRLGRFMPYIRCRTKLKITSITVEALHDITEEDAIREGVEVIILDDDHLPNLGGKRVYNDYLDSDYFVSNAVDSFRTLWQAINGEDSWNANPWVWRIEFEKIKPTQQ
jgi:hypothetical protein